MPLHEYECEKCGRFERIRKFSDPRLRKCPTCKGHIERLLSAPAIQFKGSGWYVNDYAKKSGVPGKSDNGDNGDKGGKESKSDSSKSEPSKADSPKSDSSKSDSSSGESSSSPKKNTSTDKAASSGSPSTK